jgi:uncharacterized protein (DUF488 family)
MEPRVIYTVGHSTRSLEELVAILKDASVRELVDVRSVPRSRRHPHFNAATLAVELEEQGIGYAHEAGLGGFRRPRPDSPNRGWAHPAFAGYADHMATSEFAGALERVQERARTRSVCLMCAEAQWWRCHRRLIADALLVRGWTVLHLGLAGPPITHELASFAVLEGPHGLTYPPIQGELAIERAPRDDAPAGGDV